MTNQIDCSVVIHNTNTRDWLKRCLTSIFKVTRGITFDVWVIDNESSDGSADMVKEFFPQVHLINPKGGLFVAEGFNAGIRPSTGRYVFIQDADIEYTEDILSAQVQFMDTNPMIAALGCPLYWPDGSLFVQSYSQHLNWQYAIFNFSILGKIFKKTMQTLKEQYEYAGWDRKSSRYVNVVDTALMLRRSALDQVGLYDEQFKIYCTQDDLCRRLQNAGWGVYHLYDKGVIHAQHQSVRKVSWARICRIYRNDIFHYIEKWYGALPALILKCLLQSTRAILLTAIFLKIYQPKKNMAFGTAPREKN